jgi:hypothetical protein
MFIAFRQYFVGIGACQVGFNNGAGWSTVADDGSQFQPTLHYRELIPGVPGWYATYLTTEGVPDPSQPFVRAKGVGVNAVQFIVPIMGQTFQGVLGRPTDLTPANWFACPRHEVNYPDDWGDYIGLTQALDTFNRPWAIAAFSDSTPAPACQTQTPFLGKPTHVSSQRW